MGINVGICAAGVDFGTDISASVGAGVGAGMLFMTGSIDDPEGMESVKFEGFSLMYSPDSTFTAHRVPGTSLESVALRTDVFRIVHCLPLNSGFAFSPLMMAVSPTFISSRRSTGG